MRFVVIIAIGAIALTGIGAIASGSNEDDQIVENKIEISVPPQRPDIIPPMSLSPF